MSDGLKRVIAELKAAIAREDRGWDADEATDQRIRKMHRAAVDAEKELNALTARAAIAPAEPGEDAKPLSGVADCSSQALDALHDRFPDCKPDPTAAMVGSMVEPVAYVQKRDTWHGIYDKYTTEKPDGFSYPLYSEAYVASLRAEVERLKGELKAENESAGLYRINFKHEQHLRGAAENLIADLERQLSESREREKQAAALKPSSFCQMMRDATSMQQLEHIQSCVNDLYGFEYSPDCGGQSNWSKFFDVYEQEATRLSSQKEEG